jgi:hypothetical protein
MAPDVSDAALDLLGEAGFGPVYGARPLKRAIRAQLENPLAQEILAGIFPAGGHRHRGYPGRQAQLRLRGGGGVGALTFRIGARDAGSLLRAINSTNHRR